MGQPVESPPRVPKRCPGVPSSSSGRARALGELPPASPARRAPSRLEMKFVAHVREISAMKKIQNKHSPLPQPPPPEGCSPRHTHPFSQLSPGSPRSQAAPRGSFRANPSGSAASRGADGELGGPFGAEGGSPHPPESHERSPGRSGAHTWPLPERPRTIPERPPLSSSLSPLLLRQLLGFSPTPPPRSKCPFFAKFPRDRAVFTLP